MVKRGKQVVEAYLYHDPKQPSQMVEKQYHWICTTCGKEYFFKSEAIECEISHRPKITLPKRHIITEEEYRENHRKLRDEQDAEYEKKMKLRKEGEEKENGLFRNTENIRAET